MVPTTTVKLNSEYCIQPTNVILPGSSGLQLNFPLCIPFWRFSSSIESKTITPFLCNLFYIFNHPHSQQPCQMDTSCASHFVGAVASQKLLHGDSLEVCWSKIRLNGSTIWTLGILNLDTGNTVQWKCPKYHKLTWSCKYLFCWRLNSHRSNLYLEDKTEI